MSVKRSEWTSDEKAGYLQENFSRIAGEYDRFNDISTFWLHRLWKRDIFRYFKKYTKLQNLGDAKLLDLCCGTGDIAELLQKSVKPTATPVGLDFSEGMLHVARGRSDKIEWLQGDASDLSRFADESFDLVTIGFGLRNIVRRKEALAEIHRVLKPDGIFINLDLGKVSNPVIRPIASFFFYKIVPIFGRILLKDNNDMFEYLPNSNETYYSQAELSAVLEELGYTMLKNKNYGFGQVTTHVARK